MKRQILFYLILSFIAVSSFSCSDLSRGKARDIVLEKVSKDDISFAMFENYTHGLSPVLYWNGGNETYLKMLVKCGYLEEQIKYSGNFQYTAIRPTEKISPFITYKGSGIIIKLAEVKDVAITGITGSEESKTVEFDKVFELTQLGKDISYSRSLNQHSNMVLKKYDDGWR